MCMTVRVCMRGGRGRGRETERDHNAGQIPGEVGRWLRVESTDALEGKGPQRRSQKPLDRRLEEVAQAVGGRLLSVTNAIEAGTWQRDKWLGTG